MTFAPAKPISMRGLSLLRLIIRIVRYSDRAALAELHDHRPLFRVGDRRVSLVEYIHWLAESKRALLRCYDRSSVLERATDLTIDKFGHLPNPSAVKRNGPDCRYYLSAFSRHMRKTRRQERNLSPIGEEASAAQALQRLVTRHFWLSCLEARRQGRETARRYSWETPRRCYCFWFPTAMTAAECRRWLESNVRSHDLDEPNASERIQALINEALWFPRILSLETLEMRERPPTSQEMALSWSTAQEISRRGLAEAVAAEKARNIDHLRPAIRALGSERLRDLVRRIFSDLADGDYRDGDVARTFGLSKSTFSRFAGSRWNTDGKLREGIPDLWRNTAETLARHPVFVDAARAAGLWRTVAAVCDRSEAGREVGDDA